MSGFEHYFQQTLSRKQAYPVIGPIFVSPVKAVVSVVQTIVGLTGVIFFGLLSIAWEKPRDITFSATLHTIMGLYGLAYSIINILSLGILGFGMEKPCTKPKVDDM